MGYDSFDYGFNLPQPIAEVTNDTGPCLGECKCARCGRRFGCCSEVEQTLLTHPGVPYQTWWEQEHEKINASQENEQMDMGQHYDKSASGGGGKFKRRPFLKSKDIAANGSSAKIIDFREAGKNMEYSDFLMDLAIGKKEFTWGLKSKTVTLNMLVDALGKRTEKWIGKTVKLVRGGNKGQYINVGK